MRPLIAIPAAAVLAATLAGATGVAARADEDDDTTPPKPGVTLPKGAINIFATFEANLSTDRAFKPFSLAPDISYGVTDDLTVALIHSTFAITGFRGGAGAGFCLAGEDNGCASVYNNVGVDALYSLTRGGLALAALGGVHALSLDPFQLSVRAGLRGRLTSGNLIIGFSPSIFAGVTDRDAGNKEFIWVPIFLGYRATPKVIAAVGTGIKGPLDGFGDAWTVALVPQVLYSLSAKIGLGISFAMPRILGAGALPDAQKGIDFRFLQAWVSYTL